MIQKLTNKDIRQIQDKDKFLWYGVCERHNRHILKITVTVGP